MRPTKFYGIAVSLGLLIGTLVGWHYGRNVTQGLLVWEEGFASAGYSQLASLQYEEADAQHGREALLSFTDFAKTLGHLPSAQGDRALLFDSGFAYMRLAALEELAGNDGLSHEYMLKAQEAFRNGGHTYSEDDLKKKISELTKLPRPSPSPL